MPTSVIEPERIAHRRPDGDRNEGDVVVYWMQAAQRTRHNEALEHAIRRANELSLPVAVVFCLVADYPEASARHYRFMLEGLAEVATSLRRRSIAFTAFLADPADVFAAVDHRARLLVFDRGYLPVQRRWRDEVEEATSGPIDEVETEIVVPVDLASEKLETAARTIRPKITEHLDRFIVERRTNAVDRPSHADGRDTVDLARTASNLTTIDLADAEPDEIDRILDDVGLDSTDRVDGWKGGESAAEARLRHFCDEVLPDYSSLRNRYDLDDSCSMLSPYLHFGQISPVRIAQRVRATAAPDDEIDSYLDELIVRRELAVNFVLHHDAHERFAGLPDWARQTLEDHESDERDHVFTAGELEAGETDDELWNTIMHVIRTGGWVHNQLRMYWGKQIARWTNTPQHAHRTLLELNNRWFLDGRDANSYANVAWCFGRHDQGFQEREIIGKVRPFTDQALRRKGDLDSWIEAHHR